MLSDWCIDMTQILSCPRGTETVTQENVEVVRASDYEVSSVLDPVLPFLGDIITPILQMKLWRL